MISAKFTPNIYNDRIQNGIPIALEAWNLITLRGKKLGLENINRFENAIL